MKKKTVYKVNKELRSALDTVDSMIAIKNLDGVYTYANKVVNDYYKKKNDTIIGKSYKDIYPPSEQRVVRMLDQEAITQKKTINKTFKVLTDEGFIYVDSSRSPIWNDDGDIVGVISASNNVTEREETKIKLAKTIQELEEVSKKYYQLAYTDELTKIGNRRKFYEDFLAFDNNYEYTLIIIDLNNFKKINDTFGHNKGDEVLCEFAQLLFKVASQGEGSAYRLGGDEFIVVYPSTDISFESYIGELDQTLQKYHKDVTVSFGDVVIGIEQTIDQAYRDFCIKRADDILYEYKEKKKNRLKHIK